MAGEPRPDVTGKRFPKSDLGQDTQEMSSKMIIKIELPALKMQTHLMFRLTGSLPTWSNHLERIQKVVDDFAEELSEELVWLDDSGTDKKWELLQDHALEALKVWRDKLAQADECVLREARTHSHMQAMRNGYWKELTLLRQQVYLKERAAKAGIDWCPNDVVHFTERDFIMNDEVEAEIQRQVEERLLGRLRVAERQIRARYARLGVRCWAQAAHLLKEAQGAEVDLYFKSAVIRRAAQRHGYEGEEQMAKSLGVSREVDDVAVAKQVRRKMRKAEARMLAELGGLNPEALEVGDFTRLLRDRFGSALGLVRQTRLDPEKPLSLAEFGQIALNLGFVGDVEAEFRLIPAPVTLQKAMEGKPDLDSPFAELVRAPADEALLAAALGSSIEEASPGGEDPASSDDSDVEQPGRTFRHYLSLVKRELSVKREKSRFTVDRWTMTSEAPPPQLAAVAECVAVDAHPTPQTSCRAVQTEAATAEERASSTPETPAFLRYQANCRPDGLSDVSDMIDLPFDIFRAVSDSQQPSTCADGMSLGNSIAGVATMGEEASMSITSSVPSPRPASKHQGKRKEEASMSNTSSVTSPRPASQPKGKRREAVRSFHDPPTHASTMPLDSAFPLGADEDDEDASPAITSSLLPQRPSVPKTKRASFQAVLNCVRKLAPGAGTAEPPGAANEGGTSTGTSTGTPQRPVGQSPGRVKQVTTELPSNIGTVERGSVSEPNSGRSTSPPRVSFLVGADEAPRTPQLLPRAATSIAAIFIKHNVPVEFVDEPVASEKQVLSQQVIPGQGQAKAPKSARDMRTALGNCRRASEGSVPLGPSKRAEGAVLSQDLPVYAGKASGGPSVLGVDREGAEGMQPTRSRGLGSGPRPSRPLLEAERTVEALPPGSSPRRRSGPAWRARFAVMSEDLPSYAEKGDDSLTRGPTAGTDSFPVAENSMHMLQSDGLAGRRRSHMVPTLVKPSEGSDFTPHLMNADDMQPSASQMQRKVYKTSRSLGPLRVTSGEADGDRASTAQPLMVHGEAASIRLRGTLLAPDADEALSPRPMSGSRSEPKPSHVEAAEGNRSQKSATSLLPILSRAQAESVPRRRVSQKLSTADIVSSQDAAAVPGQASSLVALGPSSEGAAQSCSATPTAYLQVRRMAPLSLPRSRLDSLATGKGSS